MSDYGPMTLMEWREVFGSLPNPTLEELAKFIERKRREDAGREASKPQNAEHEDAER